MYTIYNETGFITGKISGGENQTYVGNSIEGNYDGNLYYVVDGEVFERPDLLTVATINKEYPYELIANDIDTFTISGLEKWSFVIMYEDQSLMIPIVNDFIADGILEFQTTIPGTILIIIDCFPYKRFEIEVEAINEV